MYEERKSVSIALSVALYDAVKLAALEAGVPMAEWLRQALTQKLSASETPLV